MLTWEQLEQHLAGRRLRKWLSKRAITGVDGRCLYMLPEVYRDYMERPWPTTLAMSAHVLRDRRPAMKMVLERYVLGGFVNLNHDMKELGSDPVSSDMRGLFEFRSGPPVEQTRLFGFFARPGAFVATSFRARGELEPEEGEAPHSKWEAERVHCEAEWRKVFGSEEYMIEPWPVIVKSDLYAYLGEGADA